MIVFAVLYLAAVASFVVGIAVSPGHVFKGYPAVVTFLTLLGSGTVLAVDAL